MASGENLKKNIYLDNQKKSKKKIVFVHRTVVKLEKPKYRHFS